MATTYKTPGVYVEEISKLPPSVAQVETAIPAFIGYTQNNSYNGLALVNKPKRIKSLAEFVEIFGLAESAGIFTGADSGIKIRKENNEFKLEGSLTDPLINLKYRMYYSLQLYFANGGGPCYIISCGSYDDADLTGSTQMATALEALKKEDEPTIIIFTDAVSFEYTNDGKTLFYDLYKAALTQCAELMDRITVVDVFLDPAEKGEVEFDDIKDDFRTRIGNQNLSYGMAYYPWLKTSLNYYIDESAISIIRGTGVSNTEIPDNTVLRKYPPEGEVEITDPDTSLYHHQSSIYALIKKEIEKFKIIAPPSPAIAGVYCTVDNTRGVWKAPANVSLTYVSEPIVKINDNDQKDMNDTTSGKSVNAIRNFTGKGILVWGARTLAGNDNEWRYISVRRFYNMVEESCKKASEQFVFEPNDKNTWTKVRAMIENFLTLQWRAGALMGAKPEEAFFVRVGLGETMTALDILEGRMIVEIGLAVVRPAEFIILRFSHKMAVS
ncbi:MAG: phage tail sheath family protein [Bacteroidales bacterium]|nr:phage tail sheath family protein [Bacteroidales bacterium]